MDEREDYGAIRHSHRHTHLAPDNHRQVVDTALLSWCERQFPDNPSRCDGLKNVTFTKIQDTTYQGDGLSEIYGDLLKLSQVIDGSAGAGATANVGSTDYYIKIVGTKINVTKNQDDINNMDNYSDLKIRKVDGNFTLEADIVIDNDEKLLIISSANLSIDGVAADPVYIHASNFLTKLNNIKLNEMEQITNYNENQINRLNNKINKYKPAEIDKDTGERTLQYLEGIDNEKLSTIYWLVFYLVLAVVFGIAYIMISIKE